MIPGSLGERLGSNTVHERQAPILSVGELNRMARLLLEQGFPP